MKPMKSAFAVLVVGILLFSVVSAMAMPEEIVGTVMKNGNTYNLLAESAEYMVVAGNKLNNYVGDTVAVTGNVTLGAEFPTLHVDSVKVLSHKDLITPEIESEKATFENAG
jgi:hypothetical protein